MYPTKKLSEICEIKSGKRLPKGHTFLNEKTEYPYIRVTDFSDDGTIDMSNLKYISREVYDTISRYIITSDDLYISIAGTIGKTGIIPSILNGANLTENAIRLVYKNNHSVSNRYVYYFTTSKSFNDQAGLATRAVAMPKLAITRLKEIKIPLPPLSIQSRIVACLDATFASIDEQISLLRGNIADVENIRKSVLVETFDKNNYELLKISDIAEIINGGTPDTTNPDYWNGEIFWITPKDMGQLENIYVSETSRKITREGVNNSSAKILPVNSVVLSSRAPIGHLAINTVPMCTNQGCKGLVPGDELNHIYLYYFLLHSRDLLNSLGSGTTFKELSSTKLKEVEIPLPPLPLQHEIVAHLDRVFAETTRLRGECEAQIRDLQILKQSLLEEAFAGRLVPEEIEA